MKKSLSNEHGILELSTKQMNILFDGRSYNRIET